MVVKEVLQRKLEHRRWGVQWLAIASWQRPTKRIIKADSLPTTRGVPQELSINLSIVIWHLKQIAMVKKLSKWVHHEQTTNQKSHHFEVSSCLILHNNNKPFLWYTMKRLYRTTSSVVGPRSSKALTKATLAPHTHTHTQIMATFWWSVACLLHVCCCC